MKATPQHEGKSRPCGAVAYYMEQLKNKRTKVQKCCICGKTFTGWGNNAEPVKKGICCGDCNINRVLPARFAIIYGVKF